MSRPPDSRSYEAVLFDLDGTLIDSRPGIEGAVKAALAAVRPDVAMPPMEGLLGLPLGGLVEALGKSLDSEERKAIAVAFERHYDTIGWLVSDLYPDVRKVLTNLQRIGIRMFVVTNKRRVPTDAILDRHGLTAFFEAVFTPDSGMARSQSKVSMAGACIDAFGLRPPTVLVVGDSNDDLVMAEACHAGFAAASWGYGNAAALMVDSVGQDFPVSYGHVPCRVILGTIVDLWELVALGRGVQSDQ